MKKSKKNTKTKKVTASKRSNTPRDWFLIGGIFFGLWAVASSYLLVIRFGMSQGTYFWFSNLALFATAWGLATRNRAWLIGILSAACFTQVFWIVDNIGRLFAGRSFFGLVEAMYLPGTPVDQFLLAHSPYAIIPVCFFALYFLGKKQSESLKLVAIANPLVFAISYFAFPAAQNINCTHSACMNHLPAWAGPSYAIAFWVAIFCAHLAATYGFEMFFSGLKRSTKTENLFVKGFAGVMVLAVGVSAWGLHYKKTLPGLACGPATDDGVTKIACGYTTDSSPGNLVFNYHVKNKTGNGLICRTRAKTQYTEFVLNEGVELAPGELKKVSQVLPYPDATVDVSLSADCQANGDRFPASPNDAPMHRYEAR